MGNTEYDSDREVEYFDMLRDGHANGITLMTGKLLEREGFLASLEGSALIVVALEETQNAGFHV